MDLLGRVMVFAFLPGLLFHLQQRKNKKDQFWRFGVFFAKSKSHFGSRAPFPLLFLAFWHDFHILAFFQITNPVCLCCLFGLLASLFGPVAILAQDLSSSGPEAKMATVLDKS